MPTSGATYADELWKTLSGRINRGMGALLNLPDAEKRRLGNEGIDALAAHYGRFIGAPAVLKNDTATGVVSIRPSATTWDHVIVEDAPEEEAVISKKARLPRPPNAFILYRQHHHPIVKEAHPDLHNNQISIILGKQWKNEDNATKAIYKRHADDLKKKHMEDHPDYQYQPRKPAEKKRRITRRKAEAISNHDGPLEGASAQQASTPIETPLAIGSSPVFPVFEKTPAGNPVLTFGAENFDDKTFENLLKEFNESVTAANPQAEHSLYRVIHTERTEQARDDFTFNQDDMDALFDGVVELDDEFDAEMTRLLGPVNEKEVAWDTMDHYQQAHQWDVVQEPDPNTELQRYTTVFDNDFE